MKHLPFATSRLVGVLVVLCVANGVAQPARPATSTARISAPTRVLGVFDALTGAPVEGVEVRDLMAGISAQTTETGTVSLAFLPQGGALVRVRKVGYLPQTFFVAISSRDTAGMTIVMERLAELPAVVTTDSSPHYISPALRGFEERRKLGFGHFISEAQLRKEDHRDLIDILSTHVPGLHLAKLSVPIGGSTRRKNIPVLKSSRDCFPTIYVDGVPLNPSQPLDFRELESATQFAGIEYHTAATVPVQYNATSSGGGCVLLLWTRER